MKSQQHPLPASVAADGGFREDNTPEEETRQEKLPPTSEGMDRGATYSEQANAFPSSTSSSPSPLQAFSFDGDGSDSADGNTFVLPADAVEMAPADEIFFHGHLLPLHLLSQFSPPPSPRLSADFSDSFTLPIGEHFPDNDRCTGSTNEKSRNGSIKGNFKGRCGNRIHSETTALVSPSDIRGTGGKFKPSSLFGLPRRQRASEDRGDRGNQGKQKRKFRFELSRTVKRYVRMATSLLYSRRRDRGEDIELEVQRFAPGDLRGTYMFSAPASIATSPRNSGLVKRPVLSDTVADSTVEELQAAIQAAIAYCKKSIADEVKEEKEEDKLQT